MRKYKLGDIASVEISVVDKKIKDGTYVGEPLA